MKLSGIKTAVKGATCKASWAIKKHSPQILCVVGIVSTIAGVVAACKATPKALEIVSEHKEKMAIVQEAKDSGVTKAGAEYTLQDAKLDTIKITGGTAIKLATCFAPSAVMVGCGMGSFLWSNAILSNRLNLVMGAYTALSTKFSDYRERVRGKIGAEEEKRLYHNVKAIDVAEKTLDDDGNEVTNVRTIEVADDDDYSAIFTKFNPDGTLNDKWDPDIEQNLYFLSMKQSLWTDQLIVRNGKPVFLNEVRADLGLERTQTGQAVGWVWKPHDPNHVGDNKIDFGINGILKAFRNGDEIPDEQGIVLDFNVDGKVIYAV